MNRTTATMVITVAVALGVFWIAVDAPKATGKAFGNRAAAPGLLAVIRQNVTQRSLDPSSSPQNPGVHRYLYIQAVRYKPEVSTAHIDEILRSMEETLSKIPEIKSIRSCRVVGDSRQYDYAVLMEFDSLEDQKAYANSEIHRRWVKEHNTVGLAQDVTRMTIDMGSAH